MNCKPGDLAIIIKESSKQPHAQILGRMCTVLYAAPIGVEFKTPNGEKWPAHSRPSWVVRLEHDASILRMDGSMYLASHLVLPDFVLRPIRDPGEDARDEMLRPLPNELEPA